MLPGNYTPNGRAHIILDRLVQSSARVGHLFAAMGWGQVDTPQRVRSSFWRMMDHLKAVGLVTWDDRAFHITEAGRAAWAELQAIEPLWPVSGRVYPSRHHRSRNIEQVAA